jgi:hypothetical protein
VFVDRRNVVLTHAPPLEKGKKSAHEKNYKGQRTGRWFTADVPARIPFTLNEMIRARALRYCPATKTVIWKGDVTAAVVAAKRIARPISIREVIDILLKCDSISDEDKLRFSRLEGKVR